MRRRAKGGIAILFKQQNKEYVRLAITTERAVWVEVANIFPVPLFLATVYFPAADEKDEREHLFDEIHQNMKKFKEYGYTAICGDFNARCKANGD
ncbi:MAG: hypothetical protein AN485_22265, partial [Anabaena sp. MDT14b]